MFKYLANNRVRCPHCLTVVRLEFTDRIYVGTGHTALENIMYVAGNKEILALAPAQCPECGKIILSLAEGEFDRGSFIIDKEYLLWPMQSIRAPVPAEVPRHIAIDYNEAAQVLSFSPKASAALSRRCLQSVLREAAGATQKDLSQQIDAVLPTLPSYIAGNVDAIRNIGNFAAHPLKNHSSGEILDVEAGEAEWNLDVLDQLFDFYYVQPAIAQSKRDALNAKLLAARKPPMK